MTEKRFTIAYETNDQYCIWWAVRDGDIILWKEEVVGLLNKLNDENEQLFNFKENVFNSIDGKIKRGEQAIEWGESIGADVGAMGFHIELLKQFKKELME